MPRIEGTEVAAGQYAPLLTISVTIGDARLEGPALLDSGADITVIPGDILEAFGIAFASLPESAAQSVGAGGKFETRTCEGQIQWRAWPICRSFLVAAPEALPWALLGRDDFFKLFVVRFNWHAHPPWVQVDPVAARPGTGAAAKGTGGRKKKR